MSVIIYEGSPTAVAVKDPNSTVDYKMLWEDYLVDDTIIASEWIVDTSSILVEDSMFTGSSTTAWVSGGAEGERCRLTNRITTTMGRIDERTIIIPIKSL